MAGQVRERAITYDLGNIIEIDVCPHKKVGGTRMAKWRPTSEAQEKVNRERRRRYVTRLVELNFDERSLMLTLDYENGMYPDTWEEGKRDVANWIRRVRPLYKRAGKELRYIYCTERGEETGRMHHHVIISGGISRDELFATWRRGRRMWAEYLEFSENGYADLSAYVAKKEEDFERAYTPSKNLIKPEPLPDEDRLVSALSRVFTKARCRDFYEHNFTRAEIAAMFPGFKVCDGWECRFSPYDKGYYLHFRLLKDGARVANWAETVADKYPWRELWADEDMRGLTRRRKEGDDA